MLSETSSITRRTALASVAAGAIVATADAAQQPAAQPDARRQSPRRYNMKKSINLWAFPYPERMNLRECLQLARTAGFDGIELNYDLDNDLSPRATAKDLRAIRAMAEKIGIAISGVCSFLFWPYPLSSNDPMKRARGLELAGQMITAANELRTDNLLCVPGAVHIPWRTDHEPVPNDVCDRRARDAVTRLLPAAEKARVHLNIENIFFNGYLMTPQEMITFVDSFKSQYVKVHFDTGNIMLKNATLLLAYAYNVPAHTTPGTSPCTPIPTFASLPPPRPTAIQSAGRRPPRKAGAPVTRSNSIQAPSTRIAAPAPIVERIGTPASWLPSSIASTKATLPRARISSSKTLTVSLEKIRGTPCPSCARSSMPA